MNEDLRKCTTARSSKPVFCILTYLRARYTVPPAPLTPEWGVSAAQDRVWAEVSGPSPQQAGERLFVVLQAFIDESYDKDGVFVLGGYIATAEAWENFSREWEEMLPHALQDKKGRYHFKMREMATNPDRMERVPWFFRIIEKHVLGFVSAKIDMSDLKRAVSRIRVPGVEIDWGKYANPYFVTFRCLMDMFHIHRPQMAEAIPLDEKIDFYFDNHVEVAAIDAMWSNYLKERPDEVRQYYGANPVFRDDKEFLPLQAADFWAWWVRKWYAEGSPEKVQRPDFGTFQLQGGRKFLRVDISFNEDQLATVLKRILRTEIGPDKPIFDAKYSWA